MTIIEELAIALGFKVDPKGLKDAEEGAAESGKKAGEKFAESFKAASRTIKEAGAGLADVAGRIFKLVDSQTKALDATAKGARAAGLGAAEYQRLAHGANLSGVSIAAVAKGARTLEKSLADAKKNGTSPAAEALRQLSLNTEDFIGLPYEERLGVLGDALRGVSDEQERTLLSARLLGEEGGPGMASMLAQGSAGLREMGAEAERLGLVVGDQALGAAEQFQDQLTRVSAEAKGVARDVAMELLPAVSDFLPVAKQGAEMLGGFASGALDLATKIGAPNTGLVAVLGAMAIALGGIPGLLAATAAAAVAAGGALEDYLDIGNRLADWAGHAPEGERVTDRGVPGSKSRKELERRQREGNLSGLTYEQYEALVDDARRAGLGREAIQGLDQARDQGLARQSALKYARDMEIDLSERARTQLRQPQKGPGKVDLRGVEASGLGEELRRLGAEINATPKAIQAALESAAGSLASGALVGVARGAARSTLGGLTGRDLSQKRTSDPLLSALLGSEDVPNVALSELDQGVQPQVLLSTINNNFDIEINNTIDGTRDPSLVAGVVTDRIRAVFSEEIQAASKLAKVNFAR